MVEVAENVVGTEIVAPPNPIPEVRFAGFWRRVVAALFDSLIIELITFAIVFVLVFIPSAQPFLQAISSVLSLIIFLVYFTIFEGSSKQATPGKMILGIAVTDLGGQRISYLQALGRTAGKFISSIILGIGYLMAAFTQNKQALHDKMASCLVVLRGESHFWKAFLIGIITVVLMVASAAAYGYFIILPIVERNITVVVQVASQPGNKVINIPVPVENATTTAVLPVNVTEAQYDQILATKVGDFDNIDPSNIGPTTNLGPVAFQLGEFWTNDPTDPNVWINVMTVPIPNLTLGVDNARMTIQGVWNKSGANVYNASSSWEDQAFQWVNLQQQNYPTSSLTAIRTVHLLPGTTQSDLQKVQGTFSMDLPVGIQILTFDMSDINKKQIAHGVAITLEAMGTSTPASAKSAVFGQIGSSTLIANYQGNGEDYIGSQAYDVAGNAIDFISASLPSPGPQNATFTAFYSGDVAKIQFFIASSVVERDYPFVLQK
jgi:uncharacterized RDD family membrane protein YckC